MDDPKGEKGGRSQKREDRKKGEAVKKKLIALLIMLQVSFWTDQNL